MNNNDETLNACSIYVLIVI